MSWLKFLIFSLSLLWNFNPRLERMQKNSVPTGASEYLYWSYEVKLTWDDFTAKPDPKNNKTALTTAGLSIKTEQVNAHTIEVIIESRFQPSLSWSKDKNNDYLLEHEQKHFDLVEVYARTARKTLQENNKQAKAKLLKYLEQVFADTQEKLFQRQALYDKETDHSRDSLQQVEWNRKINRELRELKDFSEQKVSIEIL
jgi:hypothetical protein